MSRMDQGNQSGSTGATSQLRDQASQVAGQVKDMAGNVREAATEQYENLRDTATEYYDQGRQKAMEWQEGLEQYVQEQPVKALLIAAGIGALLGIIWKKS